MLFIINYNLCIYTCRPKFTGTSSLTPRPPTTPNASSSPAAATKTVNTPRDQSVRVSPKQTLSKSRKEHKKITGPRKQPARQSTCKSIYMYMGGGGFLLLKCTCTCGLFCFQQLKLPCL